MFAARFFHAVFLALLMGLFFPAAQAQTGMGWTLLNTSNQTLDFETFSLERGSWKKQQIFPNQSVRYSMTSPTGKFRISTENRGFVEYQVRDGGNYTVGWDKNKGVWDMKLAAGSSNSNAANAAPAAPAALASYELHNQSNNLINFETLDPARNTWKKQEVYPNAKKVMTFSPGVRDGRIRVATQERGFVEYDVHAGWKYSLVWDKTKGVWDFRTVQRAP